MVVCLGLTITTAACGGADDTPAPTTIPIPTSHLPTVTPRPPTPTITPIPTYTPSPTPEPTPVPTIAPPAPRIQVSAQAVFAPEYIHEVIARYPWPVDQALSVAQCESGMNPNARNSSGATGLFQIIGDNPAMFDVETNVAAAYNKYLDGVSRGNPWWHWNQFGSCGHF